MVTSYRNQSTLEPNEETNMKTSQDRSNLLAWACAALFLAGAPTAVRADDDDDDEVKIAFAQAPAAVQETIKRNITGAPPAQLEQETENGGVVYEAEYKVGGLKTSLSVAANGDLLEVEKEVPIDQLPAAVRAALERAHPGAKLKKAEAIYEKGAAVVTLYEVKLTVGGQKLEVKVKPSGELVN